MTGAPLDRGQAYFVGYWQHIPAWQSVGVRYRSELASLGRCRACSLRHPCFTAALLFCRICPSLFLTTHNPQPIRYTDRSRMRTRDISGGTPLFWKSAAYRQIDAFLDSRLHRGAVWRFVPPKLRFFHRHGQPAHIWLRPLLVPFLLVSLCAAVCSIAKVSCSGCRLKNRSGYGAGCSFVICVSPFHSHRILS